eukprot:TRINITY_DN31285_c0_g1_i1.p1 TRINITY_DN31285_c0_g1~~TRINITY_DN31285_c0_g1_i1.p1  ORF type:complete len:829 (+),score=227.03 TRINITY_DN31285_c0_g1_i1:153-2639(+)
MTADAAAAASQGDAAAAAAQPSAPAKDEVPAEGDESSSATGATEASSSVEASQPASKDGSPAAGVAAAAETAPTSPGKRGSQAEALPPKRSSLTGSLKGSRANSARGSTAGSEVPSPATPGLPDTNVLAEALDFKEPTSPRFPEEFDALYSEPVRVAPGRKLLPGKRPDHFSKLHGDHERKQTTMHRLRTELGRLTEEREKQVLAKYVKKATVEEADRVAERLHAHHHQKKQLLEDLRKRQEEESRALAAMTVAANETGMVGEERSERLYELRNHKQIWQQEARQKGIEKELEYMQANSVHNNVDENADPEDVLQTACNRLHAHSSKLLMRKDARRRELEQYERKKWENQSVHRAAEGASWRATVERLNGKPVARQEYLQQISKRTRRRVEKNRKFGVDLNAGDERFNLLYTDAFRRIADRRQACELYETVEKRRMMLVSVHAAAQTYPWSKEEVREVAERMHNPKKSLKFFGAICQDTYAASAFGSSVRTQDCDPDAPFSEEEEERTTVYSLGDADSDVEGATSAEAGTAGGLSRSASQPLTARAGGSRRSSSGATTPAGAATPPRAGTPPPPRAVALALNSSGAAATTDDDPRQRRVAVQKAPSRAQREAWVSRLEVTSEKARQTIRDVGAALRQDPYSGDAAGEEVFRRGRGRESYFQPDTSRGQRQPMEEQEPIEEEYQEPFITPAFPSFPPVNFEELFSQRPGLDKEALRSGADDLESVVSEASDTSELAQAMLPTEALQRVQREIEEQQKHGARRVFGGVNRLLSEEHNKAKPKTKAKGKAAAKASAKAGAKAAAKAKAGPKPAADSGSATPKRAGAPKKKS